MACRLLRGPINLRVSTASNHGHMRMYALDSAVDEACQCGESGPSGEPRGRRGRRFSNALVAEAGGEGHEPMLSSPLAAAANTADATGQPSVQQLSSSDSEGSRPAPGSRRRRPVRVVSESPASPPGGTHDAAGAGASPDMPHQVPAGNRAEQHQGGSRRRRGGESHEAPGGRMYTYSSHSEASSSSGDDGRLPRWIMKRARQPRAKLNSPEDAGGNTAKPLQGTAARCFCHVLQAKWLLAKKQAQHGCTVCHSRRRFLGCR